MTEQKWVDFDFERYINGDEVFYRDGSKFRGEVFYSKILMPNENLIVVQENKVSKIYFNNGRWFKGKLFGIDLVMKPKTKKLFIGVRTQTFFNERGHYCTNAFSKKEDLESYIGEVDDQYQIIEIEIEV